jgi:hypothetical protein
VSQKERTEGAIECRKGSPGPPGELVLNVGWSLGAGEYLGNRRNHGGDAEGIQSGRERCDVEERWFGKI